MKKLFWLLLVTAPALAAIEPPTRFAVIQSGVVMFIAPYEIVRRIPANKYSSIVNIGSKYMTRGYTCVKCDGTDFIAPTPSPSPSVGP